VQGALRDGDILARYGGDEFVVILPEGRIDAVVMVAERIRQAVDSLELITAQEARIRGTASIGLAVFPTTPTTPRTCCCLPTT
jgi:diguanylate cyclase (GGDEF)-like protein